MGRWVGRWVGGWCFNGMGCDLGLLSNTNAFTSDSTSSNT